MSRTTATSGPGADQLDEEGGALARLARASSRSAAGHPTPRSRRETAGRRGGASLLLPGGHRRGDVGRAVRVEALDRLHAPELAARPLCSRPRDRLEVGVVDEVAARRDLDAVAAGLEPVQEEALCDPVLRGRCLDRDTGVDEDVRGAQALLPRVDPEGEVVKSAVGAVARRRRRSAREPRSKGSSTPPSRFRRPARSVRRGGSRGRPARTSGSPGRRPRGR